MAFNETPTNEGKTMLNEDKLMESRYWSGRLTKTSEEVAPLLQKALIDCHSFRNFDVTEQYMLVEALLSYGSYAKLLADDLNRPDPEKPPFWKKLFKK